ncbi:mitochondrial inner membrane protein MPV17 [Cochliomyia hominivorax]
MTTRTISRIIVPYLAEGSRAAGIMATGDMLAQTLVEKKDFKEIDYVRTIKYGSLGLLYVGPALKYWYALLDRKISTNQGRLQRTVKKMLVDQAVMAPALNLSITALVGLINEENSNTIKERIKVQYPDIMKNNYMLWPAVQMINFSFIPLKYQVVFVQLVAVIWNCFISQLLNDKSAIKK